MSYAVLGTLEIIGPRTPYQLKQIVAEPLGYFWSFSHGQMYSEPARLTALGLITEDREEGIRRRRTLAITEAGRDALKAWLAAPTDTGREIRDVGMMKLFFSQVADDGDVTALIEQQREVHQRRLDQFRESKALFAGRRDLGNRLITIEMGILFERSAVQFWSNLALDEDGVLRWNGDDEVSSEA